MIVGQIYKTGDLNQFKGILGNRAIDEAKLSRLIDAIDKDNKLHAAPIVVNEKKEVVDGQHRLEAARRMGLEVYYYEVPGLGESDMIILNLEKTLWRPLDFARYYATKGVKYYEEYCVISDRFGLTHRVIVGLLSPGQRQIVRFTDKFKEGSLVLPSGEEGEKLLAKVQRYIEQMQDLNVFYSGYTRPKFQLALLTMFNNPRYSHEHMLRQIELMPTRVTHCPTVGEYVGILSEIYNYRQKDRVVFGRQK